MSTKTALKKVSNAITGMTQAVANTFVESASEIANACNEAFNGSLDIAKEDITAIQDYVAESATWKGTSAEGARRSEVKSIVLAYTGLETASKVFKREYGELRREHFVKLARMIPAYVTPTDAALDTVLFFEEKGSKAGKSTTPAQKVSQGLTLAINNADAGLKRALYNLCKKHGVTIK